MSLSSGCFWVIMLDLVVIMAGGIMGGWEMSWEYWFVILPKVKPEIKWRKRRRGIKCFRRRVLIFLKKRKVIRTGFPPRSYGPIGGAGLALFMQIGYELIVNILSHREILNVDITLAQWGMLLIISILAGGLVGKIGYRRAIKRRALWS